MMTLKAVATVITVLFANITASKSSLKKTLELTQTLKRSEVAYIEHCASRNDLSHFSKDTEITS